MARIETPVLVSNTLNNSNGPLILSSSNNSQVAVSGNLTVTGDLVIDGAGIDNAVTGSQNFFVRNQLDVSGSVVNPVSHLIFSSSAGSQTTVSGNLHILGDVTAVGAGLGGDVTGSQNFFVRNQLDVSGSVVNPVGHLILSSSAGSTILMSGSLAVQEKIFNTGNSLILSSSTSQVVVSGNLYVTGDVVEKSEDAGTTVGTEGAVIDTFENTDYRTVKYVVSVESGSAWFQSAEMIVLHSGSVTSLSEHSVLSLPADVFIGFEASMTGSTVNVLASGSKSENVVRFVRTTLK